jgi:hypothetical protein
MSKKLYTTTLLAFYFSLQTGIAQTAGQVKILFDCTKAETSGNADWTIDADVDNLNWSPYATTGGNHSNPQQYPTPTQTAVTSSTAETYWTGSLSHWAIDCVNKGYWVETLGAFAQLTYGNTSNAQDLSKYNIFIVDEPNILFTAAQKTAIMNFILNGGSLFIISDHTQSDRNGDGHDSPDIWNDFITNNGVQNNALGFSFDLQNFSETSNNLAPLQTDSLIHGPMGNVTQVKWTNGTSMTLNPSQNPTVTGIIYKTGSTNTGTTGVLCAYARVGCGKVVGIGDSSPADDGTGNPNATLYNGYTSDAFGNHQRLLMNATIWLARQDCFTGINSQSAENIFQLSPNPCTNELVITIRSVKSEPAGISFYDVNGKNIPVEYIRSSGGETEQYRINTSSLDGGVYYCRLSSGTETINRKVIVMR